MKDGALGRDELVFLLTEAAQIEHSVMCQYMFAAFSLKQGISEGVTNDQLRLIADWEQTILMVSRQEMEHLALVCNLLTALGGAPYMQRENFPQPKRYYPFPQALTPFSKASLDRFIEYERPADIPIEEPSPAAGMKAAAAPGDVSPRPVPFATVGELYAAIRAGIEENPLSDSELFVGPPFAQVGAMALQYLYPRSIRFTPGVFDTYMMPVTDRASAVKAIDLIVTQGEGGPKDREFSHYSRFLEIRAQYETEMQKDSQFRPARPVVENPAMYVHQDTVGATVITNKSTRQVLDLFCGVYETLLLLLIRFFGFTDETEEEVDGLLYTFYPLMTMAIRPLGEILTRMSAFDPPTDGVAGPSFEIYSDLALLPHKRSAWIYLHSRLEAIASDAADLAKIPNMPTRLQFIAESLEYIARRFKTLVPAG